MKKFGKPPPSPRADPPKKTRVRSPSPVPPQKPESRSESTSGPTDDPFSPDFEDIGEALLAVEKLFFLDDFREDVLDLYADAKDQVNNISTWAHAADDRVKKKVLVAYDKVASTTRDRVSGLCFAPQSH